MQELDLIIDENESQVVEWKESWQDKYLEWICGYANAQGGTLYIGIDDDGNVLGLEEKIVKKLLEDIPNKITAAFGMTCDVNLKTKDNRKYIQIEVKKSKLPLNLHGRYYYRTGSVKKEITGFELTEFIIKSTGTSYDEMTSDIPREKLTFESLRKRYLKVSQLPLELDNDLVSFKLMQEDGQMTNAGILFADQWNIHHSRIFCTRWNGLEKANSTQDAFDDAEYTGGLIELYDSTMAFIKNNTKKGWRKDNDKRVELPDYPERALEEGLVNALIHRSYLQTGAHSQVDIYDDRIVITNPGGMFDGSEVQLLDIRHVPSKLRNPIIADVFGRMRLMERRGSGFKKILDAYEAEERYKEELKPVFYTDGYNFFLTLCDVDSEITYSNTGDFARFLIELQEAENVYPVFTASNKKESKEDPRGPYADIRFYKNDSEENLQIYEMLLQALGNDVKVTKQGREYEISNTERDIKEELKKLEKESLPITHNKNRLPEED